jgi:hypothetical protein
VLIAFFIASLFGVPSQSTAITLTFWVFVFWFLIEHDEPSAEAIPALGLPSRLMIAAAALIVIHAGMTVVDAFGELRPRHRAERFRLVLPLRLGDPRRSRARSGRQSNRPSMDDERTRWR